MVNICILSVSDSSPPAKLNVAATDLEVKVFVVLVGVRGIFGVLVGVCGVFGMLVGVCGVFGVLVGFCYSLVGWFVWYFRFGWLVCGISWLLKVFEQELTEKNVFARE